MEIGLYRDWNCVKDPFLGVLKGPNLRAFSGIPVLGHFCIPKVRRILSSGSTARVKLLITSRGRFLGPYGLGRGSKGVWAGRR
jgi:hypothetical protein